MILRVDTAARILHAGDDAIPCMIGHGGTCEAEDKREGDGRTPLGRWTLRGVLLRPDRVPLPRLALPWRWLDREDGWSDDPADPLYNRPIRHPHRHSAERLWREDGAYDLIIPLGYNDSPPRPAAGSAIFLHCTDFARPTEGCIAVGRETLLALLPGLAPGDAVVVA